MSAFFNFVVSVFTWLFTKAKEVYTRYKRGQKLEELKQELETVAKAPPPSALTIAELPTLGLDESIPQDKVRSTLDVVYISFQLRSFPGDKVDLPKASAKIVQILNELHAKFGVLGFLAPPSIIKLAQTEVFERYAAFCFVRVLRDNVTAAQDWLIENGYGAREGEVGSMVV